jgi:hypothetical protein
MTAQQWSAPGASAGASPNDLVVQPHREMVAIAERELERALLEQTRPAIGMYASPSIVEHAAVQRAVHKICFEAHRLDLKAEQLLIGIKQAWWQLANVRARHLGERDGDVLRDIVSSSIEVFFETREASANERRD